MKSNSGGGGGGKWRITIQVFFSPERIDRRKVFSAPKKRKCTEIKWSNQPEKKKGRDPPPTSSSFKRNVNSARQRLGGEGGPHTPCRKISSRSPPLLSAVVPHISVTLLLSASLSLKKFLNRGKSFRLLSLLPGYLLSVP